MSSTISDLSTEIIAGEGLYLAAAAKLFPRHRPDRPVSPSTVFRWIVSGVRVAEGQRLRLEATRIAGRWLTTRCAIKRFLDAQAPQHSSAAAMPRTPGRREREQAQATATLKDRYGI